MELAIKKVALKYAKFFIVGSFFSSGGEEIRVYIQKFTTFLRMTLKYDSHCTFVTSYLFTDNNNITGEKNT